MRKQGATKTNPVKMSKPEDVDYVKTSRNEPIPTKIKSPLLKDTSVQYVKGVGPRRARLLERLGIKTLEDILYYFPWRYEDRKSFKKIHDLTYGNLETVIGDVVEAKIVTTPKKRMKIFELVVTDNTGFLRCKWFNQPYMEKYFKKGQKVILSGVVKGDPFLGAGFSRMNLSSGLEMENPDFEHLEKDAKRPNEDKFIHTSRIVPLYKATEGFTQKQLRTLMFNTINTYSSSIVEYMPEGILKRNGLVPLQRAIREIHFPEEFHDVDALNKGLSPGHRRMIFDEFFLLELGLALMKKKEVSERGISFRDESPLVDKFLKKLPFKLTDAQKRVFK